MQGGTNISFKPHTKFECRAGKLIFDKRHLDRQGIKALVRSADLICCLSTLNPKPQEWILRQCSFFVGPFCQGQRLAARGHESNQQGKLTVHPAATYTAGSQGFAGYLVNFMPFQFHATQRRSSQKAVACSSIITCQLTSCTAL